jgi:hypothetical protein
MTPRNLHPYQRRLHNDKFAGHHIDKGGKHQGGLNPEFNGFKELEEGALSSLFAEEGVVTIQVTNTVQTLVYPFEDFFRLSTLFCALPYVLDRGMLTRKKINIRDFGCPPQCATVVVRGALSQSH